MNAHRTLTVLALILGLAAPALADGFGGIDLPRLDFPAPATVNQGTAQPVAAPAAN